VSANDSPASLSPWGWLCPDAACVASGFFLGDGMILLKQWRYNRLLVKLQGAIAAKNAEEEINRMTRQYYPAVTMSIAREIAEIKEKMRLLLQ
jgi:hypothetical protein